MLSMHILSSILVIPGLFIANTMYVIGTVYVCTNDKNMFVCIQYRCNFSKDFLILIASPHSVEPVNLTTDVYKFCL